MSRTSRMAAFALVAVSSLSLIALAGANATGAAVPKAKPARIPHGGSLTVDVVGGGQPTLNPASPTVAYSVTLEDNLIDDNLFLPQTNGHYMPELATGYTTNKDLTQYTIDLRKGVKFQDGTPFNAAAVVYDMNLYRQPGSCICNSTMAGVESVTAVGQYQVRFTLSSRNAVFLSDISPPAVAGEMFSPTAYQKEGPAAFASENVGAGPYEVQSFEPDGPIVLKANPHYWQKGLPYLSTITIDPVVTDTSAFENLVSGGAQVLVGAGAQVLAQAKSTGSVAVYETPPNDGWTLWYNQATAPFNNPKAALALAYATNAKSIANNVFKGYLYPNESLIVPGEVDYLGEHVPGFPEYNLAKAKSLVQQIPGGMNITLYSLENAPTWVTTMEALQSQWEQAGINVTIDPLPLPSWLARRESGNYQVAITDDGLGDPWTYMAEWVTCASTNGKAFCDPKADLMINQAAGTANQPAQALVYQRLMQEVIENDPGFLPLFWYPVESIVTKNVGGFTTATDNATLQLTRYDYLYLK